MGYLRLHLRQNRKHPAAVCIVYMPAADQHISEIGMLFMYQTFKRPVIFYNHADHFFWVGVSITDRIAELREFGKNISENSRDIHDGFILSVPVDSKDIQQKDKSEMRKKLNLPVDKKIIFTGGSDFKYKPMAGKDFLTPV